MLLVSLAFNRRSGPLLARSTGRLLSARIMMTAPPAMRLLTSPSSARAEIMYDVPCGLPILAAASWVMVDRCLVGSNSTLRYIGGPPFWFILRCHFVAGAAAPGGVCPETAHPLAANGCTLLQSGHPMIISG